MKHATKLMVALAAFGLTACGTTEEKNNIEVKVQAEAPATAEGELATRGANIFVNAPNLTREQREQVMKVHTEAYQEAATLRSKLTQAKQALFKSLVAPSANQKEISKLKGKVIALDKQRLDVMLKAFDKVQKIVGKDQLSDEMIKHFTEMDSTKM